MPREGREAEGPLKLMRIDVVNEAEFPRLLSILCEWDCMRACMCVRVDLV